MLVMMEFFANEKRESQNTDHHILMILPISDITKQVKLPAPTEPVLATFGNGNFDIFFTVWNYFPFLSLSLIFNGSFKGPFDTCNSVEEFNLDERVVNALHNKFMNVSSCKLPFFGGNIYNLTQFCQSGFGGCQTLFYLARYEPQPLPKTLSICSSEQNGQI